MNPRRGAGELGVIIKLYDMDSVPEPTFLAILAENIKKWSAVTVEYQRRSDERLERASDMVHGLIETSGAMMKAFEFVSKTKSAETDALRRCNEASQERIACLVRERFVPSRISARPMPLISLTTSSMVSKISFFVIAFLF